MRLRVTAMKALGKYMRRKPPRRYIALPVPTDDDLAMSASRTHAEKHAFEAVVCRMPVYGGIRENALRMYGPDGWQAVLATLEILNEICLREDR